MRVSLFALALAACGSAPTPGHPSADPALVLAADQAFDAAVQAHDHAAFQDRVAPDAVFFGVHRLDGREAIAEAWKPIVDGSLAITWAPDEVFVSASGDLAYTIGKARYGVAELEEDEPDEARVLQATYVTIWKRGDDGVWRAAVDIGTRPEPAEVHP